MEFLYQKLRSLQNYLNDKGIPVPLFSDQGRPSLSMTLVILSFIICALGILEIVKDMDTDKAENLFMICSGLYWGRKITKDKTNAIQTTQGDTTSAS